MKVLRLPGYYSPEKFSSSHLWDHLSEALYHSGISSVVYTPIPTRGISDAERRLFRDKRLETHYDGQLIVHRFRLCKERRNPIQRAIRYFVQCTIQFFKGVFASDARNCDVMFIVSTPPIQGLMAVFVKRIRKIPLVYDLQDIFPDSLEGSGLAKKGGLLWRIGRKIEDFTYKNADKIVVISNDFKRNILSKGVLENKIEVIYNWVDTDAVHPVEKRDNSLYEEFGLSRDQFTIVYAGNLGYAQNIQIILDAARELSGVQFVIFGTGGLEEDIRTLIQAGHLNNIRILPLQPYSRVSEVYSLGDACIVSCKSGLGGSAMPSKTWSIMSCGRPVIANFDEGELKEILEQNQCGVFSQSGDLMSFVQAIKLLMDNHGLCIKMGENARQFILENLSKEVGTRKYIEVLNSVVKQ